MEPLKEVCAHIDDRVAPGLTREKIWDRGRVLDTSEEAVVFEVERHTAASGALYREGLPMSAFVTYWPCYRYDRESREITQLDERRPREFECDYEMLAEEMLEYSLELRLTAEGDRWICEEGVSNETSQVESLEDVQAFAEQLVRDWDYGGVFGWELEEVLDEEQFEDHFSTLEDILAEEARRQAREAWEWWNR